MHLAGVDPSRLAASLDPLPPDAPVVVTYRPDAGASQAALVSAILGLLEDSAVALFPDWLPEARGIDGAQGANIPAVRTLASRLAGRTLHYRSFLADLAVRALTGRPSTVSFPPESRAAGLVRVLEAAYDRADVVLLVELPHGLTAGHETALVSALEWLVHHGELGGVWLVGPPLTTVDWIQSRTVPSLSGAAIGGFEPPGGAVAPPLEIPPLTGRPHPQSTVEMRLERVLAGCPWAGERSWNATLSLDPLTAPMRVDLLWSAEHTVVEIDGQEHRRHRNFEADRARDVRLQTAGYAVLRFTNQHVLSDAHNVAHLIQRFLLTRRVR
ncbi:DUF559 domain-containing protein [Cryptosporangium phraense]|uniref:DUF559 domain-containing protein n=1 Tax=Cryptosporangium phraense TaxID=2593070 RepID=A0A545AHY0_9ACTN|nr:DUF559 domain-containing protein [Cryptosporangium phraense]TQS40870.1 DUF559 domain-containing protein [Cryptosporangium phraense]